MNKFIFTPFILIAALFLVLVTLPFLALHTLLKIGVSILNYLLDLAGYSYQFYLDKEEDE